MRAKWICVWAGLLLLLTGCGEKQQQFCGFDLETAFPGAEEIAAVSPEEDGAEGYMVTYPAQLPDTAGEEVSGFLQQVAQKYPGALTCATWGEDWEQYLPTEQGVIDQQLNWVTAEDELVSVTVRRDEATEGRLTVYLQYWKSNLQRWEARAVSVQGNELRVSEVTGFDPAQEFLVVWDMLSGPTMTEQAIEGIAPGDPVTLWVTDFRSEVSGEVLAVKKLQKLQTA